MDPQIPGTQIRTVLVDDHQLFRQGVRALLSDTPDIRIVGECGDGTQVQSLVAQLKPDVLMMDIALPGVTGIELTRQITQQHPSCRVLILSMHAEEAYVLEALRAGALGYVVKAADWSEMVNAVRTVHAGRRYLAQTLSDRVIAHYAGESRGRSSEPYEPLTRREREILKLAGEGLSSAEIGQRLSISRRTVESHRANLMRKLDLGSNAALIRYAIRKGLVPLGE
jgi:DNA-binding NarL/FixJ family response regulator